MQFGRERTEVRVDRQIKRAGLNRGDRQRQCDKRDCGGQHAVRSRNEGAPEIESAEGRHWHLSWFSLFRDGAGRRRCHSDDDNTREGCGRHDRDRRLHRRVRERRAEEGRTGDSGGQLVQTMQRESTESQGDGRYLRKRSTCRVERCCLELPHPKLNSTLAAPDRFRSSRAIRFGPAARTATDLRSRILGAAFQLAVTSVSRLPAKNRSPSVGISTYDLPYLA